MDRQSQYVSFSTSQDPLSVLLADDHLIVRIGLKNVIGRIDPAIRVDEVTSAESVISKLNSRNYHLLILDINMRHAEPFSLVTSIRRQFPALRVLIFTTTNELIFATRFLRLGVSGYLLKQSGEAETLTALTSLLSGKIYISDSLSRLMAGQSIGIKPNPFESLTNREFEVVLQLLKGNSTAVIARELHMNKSTVGTHKNRIMRKLKVSTLVGLLERARESKIV